MLEDKQQQRKREIREAAYYLLEKKGYKATSMLAIAKQAKASNETLYSWYGDKQGLFRTLVEDNAQDISRELSSAMTAETALPGVLNKVGPLLLRMLTGNKAVALNRAAAADVAETGVLGKTLSEAGREAVAPLFVNLFLQARANGQIQFTSKKQITSDYLGLLIGDIQIRRVTGALPELSDADINKRAKHANKMFLLLYGTSR